MNITAREGNPEINPEENRTLPDQQEEPTLDQVILRFFRKDIGGLLITDDTGKVIYEDEKTSFIQLEKTNWKAACPAPRPGQTCETWDLLRSEPKKTYMVTTSTYSDRGGIKQIHFLVDISLYMDLYREMTDYSKAMQTEKDHDALTGLYNKGKFEELKRTLFARQETIAVYNMDLNFLKEANDTLGHTAGDQLIMKAADSLKHIAARNVLPFRVGGDEFITVAIQVDREKAEKIRQNWEEGLAELNRREDGLPCTIACGFVYGERGFDLDEVFARADRLMYENKLAIKGKAGR